MDKKFYRLLVLFGVFTVFGVGFSYADGGDICNQTLDEFQSYFDFVNESLKIVDIESKEANYQRDVEITGWKETYFNADGSLKDIYKVPRGGVKSLAVSSFFQNPITGGFDFYDNIMILNQPPGVLRDYKKLNNIDDILQDKQSQLADASNTYDYFDGETVQALNEQLDSLDQNGIYTIMDNSRFTKDYLINYISFLYKINFSTKSIFRALVTKTNYETFCVTKTNEDSDSSTNSQVKEVCKGKDGFVDEKSNLGYYIKKDMYNQLKEQFAKLDDCESVSTDMGSFRDGLDGAIDNWSQGWDDAMESIDRGIDNLRSVKQRSQEVEFLEGSEFTGYVDIETLESKGQLYSDQYKDSESQIQKNKNDPDQDREASLSSNVSKKENQFKQNMANSMDNVLNIQTEIFASSSVQDPRMVTMQMPTISKQIYASIDLVGKPDDNDSILYYLKESCENQCSNKPGICTYF